MKRLIGQVIPTETHGGIEAISIKQGRNFWAMFQKEERK